MPPRPSGKRGAQRPSAGQKGAGSPRLGRAPSRASARHIAQRQRQRNMLMAVAAVVAVVVVIGAILAVKYVGGSSSPAKLDGALAPGEFALPAGVASEVTGIPAKVLIAAAEADNRKSASPPQAAPAGASSLSLGGKPEILFIGAEYCPICAAERWALVMALSKFGAFGHLSGTSSSSIDVNPSTPTFSFYGSTYTSPYISFVPREVQTNSYDASIGNYPTLQSLSASQARIMDKLDPSGGVPFVDLAGRYVVLSEQYDASHISGWNITDAASYMTSGANVTSRAAEAAAGYLIGDICVLSHGHPANVCSLVPAHLLGITTSTPLSQARSAGGMTTGVGKSVPSAGKS
ncbi:MAG: DUF929 family protein [Acidimicrobiales bacterium]